MGGEALFVFGMEGTFKAVGKDPTEGRRGPRVPREGLAFDRKRLLAPSVQGKKERMCSLALRSAKGRKGRSFLVVLIFRVKGSHL